MSEYKNDFIMLIELYPDILYRNPFSLASNPNITWDYLKKNILPYLIKKYKYSNVYDLQLIYEGFSYNPNLTWETVTNNPDFDWSYSDMLLNENKMITWEILFNNPQIDWDYIRIMINSNIFNEIMKKIPEIFTDINNYRLNSDKVKKIILDYIKLPFNEEQLTLIFEFIWKHAVENYPIRRELSQNEIEQKLFFLNKPWKYITWEDVIDNPYLNWEENYYEDLSDHKNISFDIIFSNPDKPWDHYSMSMHPDLTWEIIKNHPEINWEPSLVSKHSNITWDIIKNNPDYPWDIDCVLENPNITWRIAKELIDKHGQTLDYQWIHRNEFNYHPNNIRKIKLCQKQVRRWLKRNRAAKIIQNSCYNWLAKPLCKDGTIGIIPRLMMRQNEEEMNNYLKTKINNY